MDDLRIGVVGTGAIGREHIRRIAERIPAAQVVAVSDFVPTSAEKVASQYGIAQYRTAEELIRAPEVDAVLVTSSDASHAGYVLECLKARKYVFCEKPLAEKAADCERILEEERKIGKRLVQVGFMRRYDRGYREMKQCVDSGEIGNPLMIHACHRNVSQAPGFRSDMAVTKVAIHELDISRWLLGDEYDSGQVLDVRQSSLTGPDCLNPQIVLLKTRNGCRVDVEIQCMGAYGYDIQCQVVGEKGTVNLPDPASAVRRAGARCSFGLLTDWAQRFVEAYDLEFKEWTESVRLGKLTGPSAWDGYVACVAADAILRSRGSGRFEKIETVEKPSIYP